jgi:hypothetical protein
MVQPKREACMGRQLALLLVAATLAVSAPALAHHSFAMFDQDHPVDLEGVVREFKFINPHTFIVLEVKQADGSIQTWNLEGRSPANLTRAGWSVKSLKAGDEIKAKIWPLRSGAPGGGWDAANVTFRDGRPIAEPPKVTVAERPKE